MYFLPLRVLLETVTRMFCKQCGAFLQANNIRNDRMGKSGKQWIKGSCAPCLNEADQVVRRLRKLHPHPPAGSPCECCGRIDKLQLDHAHGGSRAWRGWLCRSCNIGIGHLGDSTEGVARAVAYLAAAKERESCSAQRENELLAPERSDRQL